MFPRGCCFRFSLVIAFLMGASQLKPPTYVFLLQALLIIFVNQMVPQLTCFDWTIEYIFRRLGVENVTFKFQSGFKGDGW